MASISDQMQSLCNEIVKSYRDRKTAVKDIKGEVKQIRKNTGEFIASLRKELDEANKSWTNMSKIIKNKKLKSSSLV